MITGDRAQIETPVGALGERAEASSRTRSGRALDLRATWAALVGAWQRWALAAVLGLSAALRLVGLDREAYGNTYYAAAVKSMLTSWRNFFFVSFDSGGFVTVDKPPLGLWVQAASAKLFGFNGLSLLLPEALAGVASVALLYWLVRRAFGAVAGLLAALALAVTPITVVTDRNNTMDSLLILALLLAAWAVGVAAETGRLRPLLLGGVLVGLAFNVKMLQAYLVLPALWLMYLVGAPVRWRTRLARLALATAVTLLVSFAWVAAVDLTPASARPYVGSSGNNSALSLVLGYNGLTRLTESLAGVSGLLRSLPVEVDLDVAPAFAPQIGDPGPLRLLNDGLAGQASWLLPLAVAGLLVAGWQARSGAAAGVADEASNASGSHQRRRSWPGAPAEVATDELRARRAALALWGGWLLAVGGFFSVARFYHLYYLIMLGPAVAALAGIGIAALWREWRRAGWRRALLPAALAGSAVAQVHILAAYPAWSGRLAPLVLGLALGAAVALLAIRWRGRVARAAALGAATAGVLGLLLAPTVWSAISVQGNNGAAWLPQAGPATGFGFGGPRGVPAGGNQQGFAAGGSRGAFPVRGGGGALTFAGDQWNSLDPQLVQYLLANQGGARYLVATPTSSYASLFELATDQPALALGGYQGWDRILTPDDLSRLVADGTVRFFLLSANPTPAFGGFAGGAGGQDATADLAAWVRANCTAVPASQWQTAAAGNGSPAAGGPGAATRGRADGGTPGAVGAGAPAGFGSGQSQQLYECSRSGS